MAIVKENEEKKRYLNGYWDCKRRAARLSRQIAELRSQQMFPSMENDGMPHGNTHSDLSAYAARLDELIRQLERERASAVRQYQEISHTQPVGGGEKGGLGVAVSADGDVADDRGVDAITSAGTL